MKQLLISILRNKNTTISEFRDASAKLALIMAAELAKHLEKVKMEINTPIAQTEGEKLKSNLVFIPILRSGLSILPAFLRYYPNSNVGFVGLKRDEVTAKPNLYYKNLPKINDSDQVVILDPMIATGGSGSKAIEIIKEHGIKDEKIIFVAIISSTTGIQKLNTDHPKIKVICAQEDKELNDNFYIVPGLGDFGDRFFGTL